MKYNIKPIDTFFEAIDFHNKELNERDSPNIHVSTLSIRTFIVPRMNDLNTAFTGVQCGVCASELHATSVCVPGAIPGPLLCQPERGRPAYYATHHGFQKEGSGIYYF